MIIREVDDSFIMIEQDYHAHLSAEIINQWKDLFLKNDPYVDSVLYAIKHHDYGWNLFDKQPFWNERIKKPYSFIDFPILPKTALYTQGVNEVEKKDPYAAALCSAHYMKFMKNNSSPEVTNYLKQEEKRQQRILTELPATQQFEEHLAILRFSDNISLYICLNDPGIKQAQTHYFFKEGIPISSKIKQITTEKIIATWSNYDHLSLKGLPYVPSFSVSVQQKRLAKKGIQQAGLIEHYQAVPYENIKINFNIS